MEGEKQSKMGRRLLLFPAPFTGHMNPMLNLATLLYSKGFSITIIQAPYFPTNPAHYPHFTFKLLDDEVLEKYSKSPEIDSSVVISAMNRTCEEPFRDCLGQILRETAVAEQDPVVALIADPMWAFSGSVAASFNLPKIMLRTGNMSAFLVYCSLPLLIEKGYFPPQDAKSEENIPEFPPLKVKDLPSESDQHILQAIVEGTTASQGVICNTFEELEDYAIAKLQQTLTIPIFPIGPLHKHPANSVVNIGSQDQTSIAWLNTQAPKSVLYVSFGSIAGMNEEEFLELMWGLLDSMVPFLLVIRPKLVKGLEADDPLPEGYREMMGERGHIVKWASQLEVLSHPAVGGFLTHNGWNSTLESICEGVPMVCKPLFADQNMNARHVSENWRIGLKLERIVKRDEVTRAIRKLMLEKEGAEMRSRITDLKEKATHCLEEGGSSYKSLERLTKYLLSFETFQAIRE
ncbi:unnamed protein product [Amaranthus hypochondriacus]